MSILERRWVRWGLYLSFWTFLGLFNTGQTYYLRSSFGKPIVFWRALAFGLVDWYLWAALTPIVVYLARRFPMERRVWVNHLPIHLVFSLFGALLSTLVVLPVMYCLELQPPQFMSIVENIPRHFVGQAHLYALVYWAILGVCHAIDYYRKFRERELAASELETRLAQAQLQVLKMQLDPHFLFNALNAISALISQNPEAAERVLARLAEMLRLSLDQVEVQEVTLRDELRFMEPYLEIQGIRFGDRLSVSLDIASETLNVIVPSLLLQPLVENAIRHGVEPSSGPGRVHVCAKREGDMLEIQVRDNGPGWPPGPLARERPGVGLANTEARLQRLYGSNFRLKTSNALEGGAVISLEIPWHMTAETPSRGETGCNGENTDSHRR